jgi:hypothetical protein
MLLASGIAAGASIGPAPASSLTGTRRSSLVAQSLALLAGASAQQAQSPVANTSIAAQSKPGALKAIKRRAAKLRAVRPPASEATGEPSGASEASGKETSTGEAKHPSEKERPGSSKESPNEPTRLPAITHVWLIDLSRQSFSSALRQTTQDPYLARRLIPEGTLLSNYTLTATSPLANDVALLSGQGVNTDTEQDCPTYSEVQPPEVSAKTGFVEGVGCVYPLPVKTLADELTTAGLIWRAYLQDMDPVSATAPAAAAASPAHSTVPTAPANPAEAQSGPNCPHPALGSTSSPPVTAQGNDYLPYRNPFIYFDSLLVSGACASDDVDLQRLQNDLSSAASTPNFSWIVPSACHDGDPTPCATGAPSGLAAADAFLEETVPAITSTDDYKRHGLIVITFDTGPSVSGAPPDNQRVGALLLSPFVKARAKLTSHFQTFSLLKSLERLYGVPLLGHAADPGVTQFGATVYRATETAAQAASRRGLPSLRRAADSHSQ